MTIDWNAFTPWSSLAGGALIGLAAVAASAWAPLGAVVLIVAAALAVMAIVADRLRPRLLSIAAALVPALY